MVQKDVVELSDELSGQVLLVGVLGNNRLPRLSESIDEAGKGSNKGFAKQGCFGAEIAERAIVR